MRNLVLIIPFATLKIIIERCKISKHLFQDVTGIGYNINATGFYDDIDDFVHEIFRLL